MANNRVVNDQKLLTRFEGITTTLYHSLGGLLALIQEERIGQGRSEAVNRAWRWRSINDLDYGEVGP